ncbi:MAG: NFYB/HAP3 family transcription factor subunit [Candidatus Lokiarchaeota archaeon]|nr:NFYB/HAP3 family transcription factor subunit [Candidatus Lokiarchaeota archaeon]
MAKKKRSFAWSPLRKLMKKSGANIVARNAVDLLILNLEEVATELTQQALKFAKHAKRKKITKDDMALAIKYKG